MKATAITDANDLIEERLGELATELGDIVQADVLAFIGNLHYGADDVVRECVEDLASTDPRRQRLAIVLETPGGYIEVVQRIVNTIRHHYTEAVDFIVPNFAMSAGTVFAMSGDDIHMDYYSILGPIDPQLPRGDSAIPALGYLVQYDRLIEKSKNGTLTTAEMAFLIEKFDPGDLYAFEQARDLSIALLKEWLVKYKFKNWGPHTQTQKLPVTSQMKEDRAAEIATALNDTDRWHSHGRGISMNVLTNDLNLLIEDFGIHKERAHAIRCYYKLLTDYLRKLGHQGCVHSNGQYVPLFG